MAIFRGIGGSGEAVGGAVANEITGLTIRAETASVNAAASEANAAASEANAAASEANAAASEANAAASESNAAASEAAALAAAINAAQAITFFRNDFTGDGSTVNFVLDYAITNKEIANIFIDGVYQNKDDWSITGSTLTFSSAPPVNANIEFIAGLPTTTVPSTFTQGTVVATAGQTVVTVPDYSAVSNPMHIYVNGILLDEGDDYTETTATTITMSSPLDLNDIVTYHIWGGIIQGYADASTVNYTPAGAGAVDTTVQSKLRESVSVKDFGAVGDGVTDDTAAIQAAIDAATAAGLAGTNNGGGGRGTVPAVFFPSGIYKTSSTITTSSSYQILYGDQAILMKDPGGFTGTYCLASTATSGWRQIIIGLQIQDYDGGIHFDASNTNSGNVIVDQCKFFNIQEDALYLETKSGSTIIQNCLWRSCKHDVNNVDGDYVVIRGGWIQRGNSKLTVDGDGGIINNGYMKIIDLEGIPEAFSINECCWIANYGSIVIDNMRFGGETGQCTAVNNFAVADVASPYLPTSVTIKNSPVYVGTYPAVRLFEIPNSIVLDSNNGLSGAGAVWVDWSSTVAGATQTTKIAAITGSAGFTRNLFIIDIFGCVPNSQDYGVPSNLEFLLRDRTRWQSSASDGSASYIFNNTNTAIVATNKYGTIDYVGYDASANSSGTRAQVRVEATNSTGAVKYVIATTPTSNPALADRVLIDANGNTVPGANNTYSLGDATTGWKTIHTSAVTVAGLVAAATAGAGARAFVTDANATTFASIVAGGGANGVPVYSDGTNWRIG